MLSRFSAIVLYFLIFWPLFVAASEPTTKVEETGGEKPRVEGTGVEEIVLVFKTHFDIGYTKLASEVVEIYRTTMIDKALDIAESFEDPSQSGVHRFVWTIPGWPLAKISENQTPERKVRIDNALNKGLFSFHALPFTVHVETLTEEDLVRGLRFSSNIAKAHNKPLPTAAKMTDVPCHSWFLPTLLAHSGITFMHEGSNRGCSDPEVPLLYFREGPDGSRVLTMHVNGYGSGLHPPEDWPYKTWLGLIHSGDNQGPPRPETVDSLFKEAAEKYPNIKVRVGKLEDFGNAILEKEDLTKIPVIQGDMPDTWIFGPMSDPQGQKLARSVHEKLSYIEILETLLAINTGKFKSNDVSDFATKIAEAREQSLLYGEHTWGGALYWICKYGQGYSVPFGESWRELWQSQNFTDKQKRLMASWEEHSDYIRNAAKPLEDGEQGTCVFNPLPWDVTNYQGDLLPAGGLKQISTVDESADHTFQQGEDVLVQSPWFQMAVDGKSGKITSFRDINKNRELLGNDSGAPSGFLYQRATAAMCDQFIEDYNIKKFTWILHEYGKVGLPRDTSEQRIIPNQVEFIRLSSTHAGQVLSIGYKNTTALPFDSLEMKITLYNHRREVRFQIEGKGKKADTWPEAGYFCFPLNIDSPQFRLGRLGGIVNPETQIVRGSNRHFQWLRTGLAVFGQDGYGVGICPLDTPLVSLDEPGCWKYSKDFIPKKATIWFNVFNNQKTTNFRFWNEGTISASFVVWTFDKYDAESSLITPSLEALALNHSLEVPAKDWSEDLKGISINRKGIYVTSFGRDPDSGKLMLRMWEMTGKEDKNSSVQITLPKKLNARAVVPCDLRNRPISGEIPVVNGVFEIDIKPYSPINLQL